MSATHKSLIRVLVADDEPSVLDAYRSVFRAITSANPAVGDLRARLFGQQSAPAVAAAHGDERSFDVTYVHDAESAVRAVAESHTQNRPFALVYLDMRMPPGRDGAWAAAEIRRIDARIDIVISTAYSDVDPLTLSRQIQPAAKMFYVQKPFHPHEVRQLALAIGEKRLAEERIWQLAYYDGLTGLPNRECFLDRLGTAVDRAARKQSTLAVFFLDLNNFKQINDTLGHDAGDHVLRATASRISRVLRSDDTVALANEGGAPDDGVARMGGDEFTILVEGVRSTQEALDIAGRIGAVVSEPIVLAEQKVLSTPSIGVALYPRDAVVPEELIKQADMAMYYAKRSTSKAPQCFEPSMNEAAVLHTTMENALRQALDKQELSLHYQPQLHLQSNQVTALEALLRWTNPELGSIPPLQFIPIAESSGLIVPIGEWVLRTACEQARRWRADGLPLDRVAVNVSTIQFGQPGFPELVASILHETGLEPSALELEITESVLVRDADAAIDTLMQLKAIGVQLAIDDFGTGYSSLSYLKQFPIDRLKIDRSFIGAILSDLNDQAIANAVIAMAERLDVRVTAEGVESIEQLRYLRNGRCDDAQGYEISRPMDTVHAEQFLYSAAERSRLIA